MSFMGHLVTGVLIALVIQYMTGNKGKGSGIPGRDADALQPAAGECSAGAAGDDRGIYAVFGFSLL